MRHVINNTITYVVCAPIFSVTQTALSISMRFYPSFFFSHLSCKLGFEIFLKDVSPKNDNKHSVVVQGLEVKLCVTKRLALAMAPCSQIFQKLNLSPLEELTWPEHSGWLRLTHSITAHIILLRLN